MIHIALANEQSAFAVDTPRLRAAVRAVLEHANVADAEISLAVIDDPAMRLLNRQYRGHDEPTDVLSFPLSQEPGRLEGEVVVSVETATRVAPQYGWSPAEELLLYVVHGTLHLVGFDDHTPTQAAAMRAAERAALDRLGVAAPAAKPNRKSDHVAMDHPAGKGPDNRRLPARPGRNKALDRADPPAPADQGARSR